MKVIDFIHHLQWHDIPPTIQQEGIRSLLDTLGAAIIGRSTKTSRIIHEYAVSAYGGQGAFLARRSRSIPIRCCFCQWNDC